MSRHPIADYALLSDCHGAALVHRHGSVDWLAAPRFDSPAVFCDLLGEEEGRWSICPEEPFEATRRYVDDTMVLETTFETDTGELVVRDAMALDADEEGHRLGMGAPHALLREVRCTRGAVDVHIEYSPQPEYGYITPLLEDTDGAVIARGGASVLVLSTPIDFDISRHVARKIVSMSEGDALRFAMQRASSGEPVPRRWGDQQILEGLDTTVDAWRRWTAAHQTYQGPYEEVVDNSGRVLQALTYYPTGAIIAAPTTSLPEAPGAERNWDYRYSWVRDASMALNALWVTSSPDEADRFFEYLAHSTFSQLKTNGSLQIVFGVEGEHSLHENELEHLSGWRDSRPVRIGNAAWKQEQLDVYGELLRAAEKFRDHLDDLAPAAKPFLIEAADTAQCRWNEPDHGIWEIRGPRRHYLYSKLMCWVALDRALRLSEWLEAGDRIDVWTETRDEIRRAILERGWSEELGAFTQAFDRHVLDATALSLPRVGFLPADDERMLSTMDAIERELTDESGLVYRYRADDGLQGDEGSFLLCTFWLAEARARAGQLEQACEVFERAIGYRNDLDLLAEQVDASSGELVGNFPQAFSHIGLISAAWAISQRS